MDDDNDDVYSQLRQRVQFEGTGPCLSRVRNGVWSKRPLKTQNALIAVRNKYRFNKNQLLLYMTQHNTP